MARMNQVDAERDLLAMHPDWCVTDHNNPNDPHSFHERPTLNTGDLEVSAIIDRYRGNGPEPLVNVRHEDDNLTPTEARQLAEAILEAVRLIES